MNISKIFKGTLIVSLMIFLAKIVSFISETTLAYSLGSSSEADIYYTIIGIQQIIYPMISIGVWKIFLPEYKKKLVLKKENDANQYSDKIITLFIIISIVFVILLIVFSKYVTIFVVPGFDKVSQSKVTTFLRFTSPMYLFLCVSTIYGAMLQSRNKFFGSQIREIVVQIPTIIASIFLYRKYGLYVLGLSLIVGSFLRFIIELPFVNWNYKFKPNIKFKDKDIFIFFKRLPSALLTASFTQIHSLIDKIVASGLSAGSIACLNYGVKVSTLISGLFSQAINTAVYPTIAGLIAEQNYKNLSNLINIVINIICFFIIPVSFGCIVFNYEIVNVLFARGAFQGKAIYTTGLILAGYSIGLIFTALITTINDILYCHGKANITMKISMFSCIMTLLLDLIVVNFFGVFGLALATSISSMITFFIALKFLNVCLKIKLIHFDKEIIKISFASLFSVLLSRILFYCMSSWNSIVSLCISIIIAFILYLFLMIIMKSNLIKTFICFLRGENNDFIQFNKK